MQFSPVIEQDKFEPSKSVKGLAGRGSVFDDVKTTASTWNPIMVTDRKVFKNQAKHVGNYSMASNRPLPLLQMNQ